MSLRERALSSRSLVCLLQALTNKVATIELRDETEITGRIVHVDAFMNTSLEGVHIVQDQQKVAVLEVLYVKGRNIRYVRIPDEVNIIGAIKRQLTSVSQRRTGDSKKNFHRENRRKIIETALEKREAASQAKIDL